MCSKSEANTINSSEFELVCGGDFVRCWRLRKNKRCKSFTLLVICHIWSTSRWTLFKDRCLVLCPFVNLFYVYPLVLHAHFTSWKRTWKRFLFAICHSWATLLANRCSVEASQLWQIASKLRCHASLQDVKCAWSAGGYMKNMFTNGQKTHPLFLKKATWCLFCLFQ